jgi:hypothetical protein
VRLVYALWPLILLASLFALAPNAASGVPGSQMYCSHPSHGKDGYYGPCHPGINNNNPETGKDLNEHIKANPTHSGYAIAQACTT